MLALNEKNISKKTIFIVEISSYQISYSKIFKPNYGYFIKFLTQIILKDIKHLIII